MKNTEPKELSFSKICDPQIKGKMGDTEANSDTLE